MVERYCAEHGIEGALLRRVIAGRDGAGGPLPHGWEEALPTFPREGRMPTRAALDRALAALQPVLGNTFGGCADLTPSVFPKTCLVGSFARDDGAGSYIRYGVREHGMVAVANGIQAYGGLRAYVGTFTNFYGYALGAVRLTAVMRLPVLMVSTHDSVFVGEDGVTHQPVEMIPQLRAMPGLRCIRPADAAEVNGALCAWLRRPDQPTIVFLSRQAVGNLQTTRADAVMRGAYVVRATERPGVVVVATGSEVELCVDAAALLQSEHGVAATVVSMPCTELFEEQDAAYRRTILPDGVPVVSVEAAATQGWERYAHYCIGIDRFGTSAPGDVVKEHFGFMPGNIARRVAGVARHFEQHGPPTSKVPPAALDYRAHNVVADPCGTH